MQKACESQSLSVQKREGFSHCSGKEKIWRKAKRVWRADEAYLQKEGKDYKENHIEAWVHSLQEEKNDSHQTLQVFRYG